MRYRVTAAFILALTTLASGQDSQFGATVFYEYTYWFDHTGQVNSPFEMQRVYFTFEKQLSPALAYKFQSDIGRGRDGWLTAYLKNAKMDWTTPQGKFTFGMLGMNMFSVKEKTWGHRYLEKSALDLNGWASSADLGLGFTRSFNNLHLDAKLTNGEGYKRAEADWYKKVSLQLVLGELNLLRDRGFNVGGVVSYEPFDGADGKATTIVAGAFGGWATDVLRTGAEANVQTVTDEDNAILLSGYATYNLGSRIAVLARYDQFNQASDSEMYVLLGLAFAPENGLTITPNFRYGKSESRTDFQFKVNFHFDV